MPAVACAAHARVVACASRTIEAAQAFAGHFAIPKVYAGIEDLVRDPEIDAVLTC